MAEARKKLPKIVTPAGKFRFPKLTEPDYGNKKFPKPDGEYSVQLVFDAESAGAKEMIEKLTPHYEAALAEAEEAFAKLPVGTRKKLGKVSANDLFTTLYDKETEEPTGEIMFKATMKASGVVKKDGPRKGKKWTRSPIIFDAKGARMAKAPSIWSGTIGKVSAEISPYFIPGTGAAGLKLNLEAVQIIDLVSDGQRSASSYGFGEEEGYEYEEPAEDEGASFGADADNHNTNDDAGDF